PGDGLRPVLSWIHRRCRLAQRRRRSRPVHRRGDRRGPRRPGLGPEQPQWRGPVRAGDPAAHPARDGERSSGMSRILIAEDNPRISSFVEKGLRANGFTTTVVADGIAAVDYATTGEFDLMILDLGLPGRDGFSVLAGIRSVGVTTPVIILTARDSVGDTVAGLENGADDYMTKPFR